MEPTSPHQTGPSISPHAEPHPDDNPNSLDETAISGKWAILAIVLVAFAMASFAWYFRWQQSQQVLTHWGPQAATTIRLGDEVELLWFAGEDQSNAETADVVIINGQSHPVRVRRDLSSAPGLIHARHHLLHPRAFRWNPAPSDCENRWDGALQFRRSASTTAAKSAPSNSDASTGEPSNGEVSQEGPTATLVFDFQCHRILLLERNEVADMEPIAADLQQFLHEWK